MPITYITTDQSARQTVASNNTYVVTRDVAITASATAIGLSGTAAYEDIDISVLGELYGDQGINLFGGADELDDTFINIGSDGYIFAETFGILLRAGEDNVVVNNGEIVGSGTAVYIQGGEARLTNHGVVTSGGQSIYGAVNFGPSAGGNNVRIVENIGQISGDSQGNSDFTGTITNVSGAEFYLTNSGSITGGIVNAVYTSATENYIDNSGTISGNIIATNTTRIVNSGVINGDVELSSDADVYISVADGYVSSTIFLGAGTDQAFLGNAGEVVEGDAGNDSVYGGTGADVVNGGANEDLLRGGQGNDTLSGGTENDTVRGGQGDDELFGDAGDDVIRGGAGEDEITGGLGSDTMTGGAGEDVFIFTSVFDSPDNSTRDVIQDFTVGEDLIDLSFLGAGTVFLGDGTFSGAAATSAEVIVTDPNAIGRVKILIDLDEDGVADMKIVLNNTTALSVDDFIL